ncbi:THAP domain-containing protein 8 isoform X1 [Struthio camelus]
MPPDPPPEPPNSAVTACDSPPPPPSRSVRLPPPPPPAAAGGSAAELSTEQLVGLVLLLQRKVKGLQQRRRRHCARLEAMESLVQRLRAHSLPARRGLGLLPLACLQPEPGNTVTVVCRDEEPAVPYAAPQTAAVPRPEEP